MNTTNQVDNRRNTQEHASLRSPVCESGNGNLLRNLATHLLLGAGAIGAGFGIGEAKATATEPGQSVQRSIKQGKVVTPQKTTFEVTGCEQVSGLVFEAGSCYVTDVTENKAALKVTMGVGLNVNVGTLLIGVNSKAMASITCDYPPGTDRWDAYRATSKELAKKISNEMKPALVKALGAFTKTGDIMKVDDRSQDKAWKELLRKSTQRDKPPY